MACKRASKSGSKPCGKSPAKSSSGCKSGKKCK